MGGKCTGSGRQRQPLHLTVGGQPAAAPSAFGQAAAPTSAFGTSNPMGVGFGQSSFGAGPSAAFLPAIGSSGVQFVPFLGPGGGP